MALEISLIPPPAPSTPNSRRDRSATALRQITNLRNRGSSKGTSTLRITPSRVYDSQNFGAPVTDLEASDTRANPRPFAKFPPRPTSSFPPEGGQMARAPSNLRIQSNARGGGMRGGPNLRGRSAGRGRGGKEGSGPSGQRDTRPKRRERKAGDGGARPTNVADVDPAETLSDGMVLHLLRLQRKEWDRTPYEPKYVLGSFAAQELIHEGRELFKGESPPVKIWGELEQRIGVVGMFGAEAHLKVRRVGDGDDKAFGQEEGVSEEKKYVAV